MIEELDDDNALCGLTKDGVSTALMLPASTLWRHPGRCRPHGGQLMGFDVDRSKPA